jgi:hypothetical protein
MPPSSERHRFDQIHDILHSARLPKAARICCHCLKFEGLVEQRKDFPRKASRGKLGFRD